MTEMEYEPRERPWWQSGSDKAFADRIKLMALPELQAVSGEMKGARVYIQSQLEARPDDKGSDWWKRARQSIGFISRRNHAVGAEIAARNDERRAQVEERKRVEVSRARAYLAKGDLVGTLSLVLDMMEGKHAARPET